jgi:AcrR family transcriptional regulator
MAEEDDPPIDPKDEAILRSAFVAFARYGLRRTSMADIAKGAGMSRPALYLRYAGKDDIFNAMIRIHFERSERSVERVLAASGPPADVLLATLYAFDGDAMEEIMNSPHADEFLSASAPFSQAAVQEAHARITGHIARWIAAGVAEGRLSLGGLGATAEEVAATFMAAKSGIKAFSRDFASYRAAEARVAAVFGKALGR